MKRLMFIAALLVFTMSFGASAARTPYWEEFQETAQIDYAENHGELQFYVQPFEFNNGRAMQDGMEAELHFNYGISPKTEIGASFAAERYYNNLNAFLKHKLVADKGFALSILGGLNLDRYPYQESNTITPSVGLLFDNYVNNQVRFNNNVRFFFYETGNVGVDIENGLVLVINPRNAIKAKLETYFTNTRNITHNLMFAYRSILTDKVTYNLLVEKDFGSANTHFENIIEVKPVSDLKLTGNYVFNTQYSSWIQVKAEKELVKNVNLVGEYQKQLVNNGYSYLKTGIDFKF